MINAAEPTNHPRPFAAGLRSKLKTFLAHPLACTTSKWRRLVTQCEQLGRRLAGHYAARCLLQTGCLEVLTRRPAHAYPPDHADLWFLYQTVRQRHPRCIFEFGSGCSTVALACALADEAARPGALPGHLYSIEADPYWAEITRGILPARLRPFCTVITSPAVTADHAGTTVWRHSTVPDIVPDLVYLDGPELAPDVQVADDLLRMEPRLARGFFLIVDGRLANVAFLTTHLQRRYRVHHRHWFRNTTFELES